MEERRPDSCERAEREAGEQAEQRRGRGLSTPESHLGRPGAEWTYMLLLRRAGPGTQLRGLRGGQRPGQRSVWQNEEVQQSRPCARRPFPESALATRSARRLRSEGICRNTQKAGPKGRERRNPRPPRRPSAKILEGQDRLAGGKVLARRKLGPRDSKAGSGGRSDQKKQIARAGPDREIFLKQRLQ